MAAPHVAGVAALIISRTASKRMAPAQVAAVLVATATRKPCPTSEPLSTAALP
jgi:subtilisin family serine protease